MRGLLIAIALVACIFRTTLLGCHDSDWRYSGDPDVISGIIEVNFVTERDSKAAVRELLIVLPYVLAVIEEINCSKITEQTDKARDESIEIYVSARFGDSLFQSTFVVDASFQERTFKVESTSNDVNYAMIINYSEGRVAVSSADSPCFFMSLEVVEGRVIESMRSIGGI